MTNIVRKPVTGSVQQKNGAWHAVLNITDFETGKRKSKWKKIGKISLKRNDGGITKKEANNKLHFFITEEDAEQEKLFLENQEYMNMTYKERHARIIQTTDFYEYVSSYIESVSKTLHIKTYDTYRAQCNGRIKAFFHGKYTVEQVDYSVLKEFFKTFDDDGLARTTKTRYKALLSLAFKEAIREGAIAVNPFDLFVRGAFGDSSFKTTTYKKEDLKNFTDKLLNSDDRIGPLVAITLYYALRRAEVLGWKWSQIDFEKKTISLETSIIDVPMKYSREDILKQFKGVNKVYSTEGKCHIVEQNELKTDSSATEMPLLSAVVDILKKIKAETERNKELFGNCYDNRFEDYVFVRQDGYIITPTYVTNHFPLLLEKLGMQKIRFHDIRHTTATRLFEENWSIKHIQKWLRHTTPETTSKFYVHPDSKELERIGESIEEMYQSKPETEMEF